MFKYFLFLVLVAILCIGAEPFNNCGRRLHKKEFCDFFLNRAIGLEEDGV